MSIRDLMRRLDRIEFSVSGDDEPADTMPPLDPATLSAEQIAALSRLPRTLDGKLDTSRMDEVSDQDLKTIAQIRIRPD